MKVREKVTKVKSLVDHVLEMKDPHRQLTLMRMYFSGYKMAHVFRTTKTINFDSMINEALSVILDLDLQTPALRETLGLPFRLGGMGITSASIISTASFYASRRHCCTKCRHC
jgi:hypothetical protein